MVCSTLQNLGVSPLSGLGKVHVDIDMQGKQKGSGLHPQHFGYKVDKCVHSDLYSDVVPLSINNLWLDNLNLVTDFLTEKFFISVRYDSNPFSFLNKAYVLSLLVSFEIFSNASCVKISLSLSESFLKTNRGLSE